MKKMFDLFLKPFGFEAVPVVASVSRTSSPLPSPEGENDNETEAELPQNVEQVEFRPGIKKREYRALQVGLTGKQWAEVRAVAGPKTNDAAMAAMGLRALIDLARVLRNPNNAVLILENGEPPKRMRLNLQS